VDYPVAYFYNATANLNLGQIDAAEKSARAGEKLDTAHRYPKAGTRAGDDPGAERRIMPAPRRTCAATLMLAPDAEDAARMKRDLAELERLSGANEQASAAHE
jgi:hypothetical protein